MTEDDTTAIIRRIDLSNTWKVKRAAFERAITPQEPFSKMLVRAEIKKQKILEANKLKDPAPQKQVKGVKTLTQ